MKTIGSGPRLIVPLVVGAVAVIICMTGVAFLAFALINTMQGPTWKDNANQPIHTVSQEEGELTEESYSPRWAVDTGGIELPDECIPSSEAFEETADIAEAVFGATPYSRAYMILRTQHDVDSRYFDALGDLFWDVMMDSSKGIVHAWIDAYTGEDIQTDITPFDSLAYDYWAFFDEWAESGSESEPSRKWGALSDDRQTAEEESFPSVYGDSSKERSIIQRENAAALATNPMSASYAEEALRIVDGGGLGNGAEALSATVCVERNGHYLVDVELSDGDHLVLHLPQDDPGNVRAYERHRTSLLDLLYPL